MSLLQTNYAKGIYPMPTADDSDVIAVRMEYSLAAALALNDVIEMGPLPADHVPVDCVLDADDLDTNGAPTITLSVGILNAGKTAISTAAADGGAAWIAASTVAQAGGLVRPTVSAITRVAPDAANDRPMGVLVAAGPATGAATGKVGLTVMYRASSYGA